MNRFRRFLLCVLITGLYGGQHSFSAEGTSCLPGANSPKTDQLAFKFYQLATERARYQDCREIAEEMCAIGVASGDQLQRARGLIRLAYCEIRFGRWGNDWRGKLGEVEGLLTKLGTLGYAELLLFRGHMVKWRPQVPLSLGISDVQAAIVIASQTQNDLLLVEAYNRLADLVLLEGQKAVCRSHALHALKVSDHLGYREGTRRALLILTQAFLFEDKADMALPYAKRLLKIEPSNAVACSALAHFNDSKGYANILRQANDELQALEPNPFQQDQLGRNHMLLGYLLSNRNKSQDAVDHFRLAAQCFKEARNTTNYISSLLKSYTLSLDRNVPIPNIDPLLKMIENREHGSLPLALADIVRILEATDHPSLAGKLRQQLRLASDLSTQREHERAETAATQRLQLENNRRDLEQQIESQKASARLFRITVASAFALFVFSLLAYHLIANRTTLRKLQAEALSREQAQAKSQELTQQLLRTQKLDALGTLSAGIAHDFNNTLHAISMLAELVKAGLEDDSSNQQHLDTILQVTQQGSSLTRGMLLFSRQHETVKSTGDLISLVRETVAMVRHMVPASISIFSEVTCGSSAILVDMNESQIKQVLLNLVINARDAMPEGGDLVVRVGQCNEELGDQAILTISDNGTGMTEEVQSRVFEPFFTTKDRGRGTGLGMSIAHGVLEDHGGSIRFESELGVGTTATLTLPTVHDQRCQSKDANLPVLQVNGDRVLLTEDNDYIRWGTKLKLEKLGFRVFEAKDGLDALDVHANMNGECGLVLMDIDLPGLGGPTCVDKLRSRGEKAPVIFMTGMSTSQIEGTVLAKPFTEQALQRAILDVRENHTQQNANLC